MRDAALIALLSLAACNKDKDVEKSDPLVQDGVTLVKSDKARDTSPDCTDAEVQAVADGDAAFAFDLYHELAASSQDDLFFSPHSVSVALAMMWAGAHGDTESQMADALHYTLTQDRFHPAMNGLDLMLEERSTPVDEDASPFTLDMVNALWGQTGVEFQSAWLDVLGEDYGAGIYTLDIAGDPEGARDTINAAIADATDDKIKQLLPPGSIGSSTALVLTNAILFKAAWSTPFETSDTSTDPFTLDSGATVSVPTMHGQVHADYALGDGYDAVELSYDAVPYTMMIIVPDSGFSAFEATLDATTFAAIRHDMSGGEVDLSLPRWDSSSAFSLISALDALGMTDAFGEIADFSGINETLGLYISDVIHQAVISVDEEGTEAAAATAVISDTGTTDEDEPVEIKVDRPFIYAIIEHESGTVLFLGREMDPS